MRQAGHSWPITRSATDIAYALLSPEVHRILTVEQGWPADCYERWIATLLPAGQRPPAHPASYTFEP